MFGTRKKIPKIKTKYYELIYEFRNDGWSLQYKNISFYLPSHEIVLPETEELDAYLKWVDEKKDYIEDCVSEMFSDWEVNINKSAAHIAQIEIETPGSISVMVLGDHTWGDMGYDIWFKNGVIVNEGAGD